MLWIKDHSSKRKSLPCAFKCLQQVLEKQNQNVQIEIQNYTVYCALCAFSLCTSKYSFSKRNHIFVSGKNKLMEHEKVEGYISEDFRVF